MFCCEVVLATRVGKTRGQRAAGLLYSAGQRRDLNLRPLACHGVFPAFARVDWLVKSESDKDCEDRDCSTAELFCEADPGLEPGTDVIFTAFAVSFCWDKEG